jgi:hypothetical protein
VLKAVKGQLVLAGCAIGIITGWCVMAIPWLRFRIVNVDESAHWMVVAGPTCLMATVGCIIRDGGPRGIPYDRARRVVEIAMGA